MALGMAFGDELRTIGRVFESIQTVIRGKNEQIKLVLCAWMSGGHILIEDLPGTGKTILARALAKSVNTSFKRVQFTPDLLPSDILGSSIYNQKTQEFVFLPGPIFTTVFLGDEINRATPRTQSALLEAMGEGNVTIEGTTQSLNPLFFVIATQNPIEQHGTFPLPEAQLDRFTMKISMGYPSPQEEIEIIKQQNQVHPIHQVLPVADEAALAQVRASVSKVKVSDVVYQYASSLVQKTRQSRDLRAGVSPRAMIALIRSAQCMALFDGLDYVRPTHLYHLFKPVWAHRLLVTPEARIEGKNATQVLDQMIKEIQMPVQPG